MRKGKGKEKKAKDEEMNGQWEKGGTCPCGATKKQLPLLTTMLLLQILTLIKFNKSINLSKQRHIAPCVTTKSAEVQNTPTDHWSKRWQLTTSGQCEKTEEESYVSQRRMFLIGLRQA